MMTEHDAQRDAQRDADQEPFVGAVRRAAARLRRGHQITFWQGLAQVGAVGWMIVLPTVAGAVIGRYVDAQAGSGLFATLSLLMLGLALGCVTAWRHVTRELRL